MVFSSPVFLFIFFPCFLAIYSLIPLGMRNVLVLLASLGFYLCGAGSLIFVALGLLIFNYFAGILLTSDRFVSKMDPPPPRARKVWILVVLIGMNLLPLMFFKYLIFFSHIVNDLTGIEFQIKTNSLVMALPLGISFYTFHFLSYLIDVYTGTTLPERSFQRFAIYIFLFPHLIAGPIVRYSEIRKQLHNCSRRLFGSDMFWGMVIFIIGLSKKILIADPIGAVVDNVHNSSAFITTYSAWLSAICYSFQIYFDFSGYTDMATGMARMLGFHFPRNFNRPYAAYCITEFWRRWHMTLSRWFRDYVYIPLGGNRTYSTKIYRNLFIVFTLCALWHGAAYTFLVWGIGHGILLALERAGILPGRYFRLGGLPVFLLATLLWVPFRAENLAMTGKMFEAMFWIGDTPLWLEANRSLADFKVIFLLALASVICLLGDKPFYRLRTFCFRRPLLMGCYSLALYLLSGISVVERGFNPFIYFQF